MIIRDIKKEIDFNLDHIINMALNIVGKPCKWCGKNIKPKTFCFDHKIPLSRDGTFKLDNLDIIDSACNQKKGKLLESEYSKILQLIDQFPPQAKADVMIRLGLGGKWSKGH